VYLLLGADEFSKEKSQLVSYAIDDVGVALILYD
jgi:hypothetical protein